MCFCSISQGWRPFECKHLGILSTAQGMEERQRSRSKEGCAMKRMIRNLSAVFVVSLFLPTAASGLVIFSDAGANIASITDTVDAFRGALGAPNNGNNPGPLPAGRREINWDGGGPPVIDGTAPVTPFTVFQ